MRSSDAEKLVEYINKTDYKPTDWETDFLATINEYIENSKDLTPKQSKILNDIYEKSTGDGLFNRREII